MQESNFNKIQDYFENKMSEVEATAFKLEIEKNTELQKEVEEYKSIVQGIESFGMKKMLDEIHNDEFGVKKKKEKNAINKLHIVGGVLILAALIGYLLYPIIEENRSLQKKQPFENINMQFAQNMPVLEGLPVTLSSDNNVLFQEAMVAYRMKDYKMADKIFAQINMVNQLSDTLSIYHANALIELGSYQQAISLLSPLTITDSSPYYYDAIWFQAKAFLSYNKIDSARVMIKKLTDSENKYQDGAIKIYEEIGMY